MSSNSVTVVFGFRAELIVIRSKKKSDKIELEFEHKIELNHDFNFFVPSNFIVRRLSSDSWMTHITDYTLSFDINSNFVRS